MVIILITFLAFLIPVAIVLWMEWKKKRESEAREGRAPGKKESVSAALVARASLLLLAVAVPVYLGSEAPYSFFAPDDALLKIAFKHTGAKVYDCDEAGLVRQEGERYRQELKETRQVKMNIERIANCPRERHPVDVELFIDGQKVLDRSYAPTGIKKDMASYVYDEVFVKPGSHRVRVLLYDAGGREKASYVLDAAFIVKPADVKAVWFDQKAGGLVLG